MDVEQLRPLLGVRPHFRQGAFETIEEKCGSLDVYRRDGLGLTDAGHDQLCERDLF